MKTIRDASLMQQDAEAARLRGSRLALVPTMGALHDGHVALLRAARERADLVILSVFVNPTQFGKGEDYERYPRDIDRDSAIARDAGADVLFVPSNEQMYEKGFQSFVTVEKLSAPFEGESRPGHFRGVATVVAKLLNITKPHLAVFGQKDAQQAVVVRRMIRDLNFDVELLIVPTVREADGLAMSSRNAYLSPRERGEAAVLSASLRKAEELIRSGERRVDAVVGAMRGMISLSSSGAIDYIAIADADSLARLEHLQTGQDILVALAVRFGKTRLIDNIQITT
ncbi:MAG TPA: pantoate--beta-alanine ligase [Bacteroidota bacterium]|nr:pantoate--beta-alanine ligase [Bacteroidota bacterium]